MTKTLRKVILGAVIIAVLIIIVYPNFKKGNIDDNNRSLITNNPTEALQNSISSGRPILLEFYSVT